MQTAGSIIRPLIVLVQEFLKVFDTLRDEIVNDELLAGQPESSMQWVKEVRSHTADGGRR